MVNGDSVTAGTGSRLRTRRRVSPMFRRSACSVSGSSPRVTSSPLPALSTRSVAKYTVLANSTSTPPSSTATTCKDRPESRASRSRIRSPTVRSDNHVSGLTGTDGIRSSWDEVPSHNRARFVTCPVASRSGLIFSTRGPGSIGPVRTLGPPRSIETRRSWSNSDAAART